MSSKNTAFNINLLTLTPENLRLMRPVRVMDMFDGASDQFHPDGLFSTLTFGKIGDPERKQRFSYIDLKVSVIHPVIWKALGELKQLYHEILLGTTYAVYDPKSKDFERSDATRGKTGYHFFISNWHKLVFEERSSLDRKDNIKLVYKWRDKCMVNKLVVIPAGFRDVEFDKGGRPSQDEINDFYRQALAIANNIVADKHNDDQPLLDTVRVSLQKVFNNLYENIMERLDGKRKLVLGKVASRRIFNGTRNVLTSQYSDIRYLGGPGEATMNHSYMGIYQSAIAFLQKSIYAIRNKYLSKIVFSHREPARLINRKTLESEEVRLSSKDYNSLLTPEGIEALIHHFGVAGVSSGSVSISNTLQSKPFVISDHYVALIYKGEDQSFKVFFDIRDLPPEFDKARVTPITFTEFMYCSLYDTLNDLPVFITRYPITGVGSIYPSKLLLQSTLTYEARREITVGWEVDIDNKYLATRFPKPNEALYQSMAPNQARLSGLTADFDGDMGSGDGVLTDEAIDEVNDYMNSKRGYIGTDGKLIASAETDNSNLLFHNLTKPVQAGA